MKPASESPWIVLKFGGSSVSSSESWGVIVEVVSTRVDEGLRPLIVHSALSGVSNRLEELIQGAAAGGVWKPLFEEVVEQHHDLVRRMELESASGLRQVLDDEFSTLERSLSGMELLREVTPRTHARVLAAGELLATRIGAAMLGRAGIPTVWVDARTLLRAHSPSKEEAGSLRTYLSAHYVPRLDVELATRLRDVSAPAVGGAQPTAVPRAVLTQGFIASSAEGETVLLGKGGSDASGAYLAVAVAAERLEIWTDVPGMFTADPRLVPTARVLRTLAYDEAQEIATTGSKVLHPRCIPAVRDSGIPILIRSTLDPESEGTVVSSAGGDSQPGLKAISVKTNVVLVTLETLGMWQEVGFLAGAFERIRAWGLSIDLVSTSETNVTVSLDAQANTLDPETLSGLVEDLSQMARVRVIEPCTAISLVGRGIGSLLPKLGPALEAFDEERVHLVAQAANDLNFTFVVDEEQSVRIVKKLHHLFLSGGGGGVAVGPTWDEVRHRRKGLASGAAPPPSEWWAEKRDLLLDLMASRGSAYVYDLAAVTAQAERLRSLRSVDRVLYSMKANGHADVLRAVRRAGLGIECVSEAEVCHALDVLGEDDGTPRSGADGQVAPIRAEEILFTPNFAPREEYALGLERGVRITVDALHPLEHWPDLFHTQSIFLRVDTGGGRGHHEKVRTAGPGAKFGVPIGELPTARALAEDAGASIVGLHVHAGSGILEPEHWERNARALAELAEAIPSVRYVDLGGGLGVPHRFGQPSLDLSALDRSLEGARKMLGGLKIWLEPGRFIVADAGVLLARVTQLKRKDRRLFIGLATGMNSLIRPALYGAHHEIVNLTQLGEAVTELATVVGPICETGDRLGVDRLLPKTREGDVMLIAQVGAYGRVMASSYNLRLPADEIVIG